MYFPSFEWVGHEEQLRICPELAVLQNSVWVRGETEAEVINRNTNTATLTELQSSVINNNNKHSSEICLVQPKQLCWEKIQQHTHTHTSHLSRSFAQRRVGETHTFEEDSVVRPDSNFQVLIQSAILEQT